MASKKEGLVEEAILEMSDMLNMDLEYRHWNKPELTGSCTVVVPGTAEAGLPLSVSCMVSDSQVDSGGVVSVLARVTSTLWLACCTDARDRTATVLVVDGRPLNFAQRESRAGSVRVFVTAGTSFSRRRFCSIFEKGVVGVFERDFCHLDWRAWTKPAAALSEYLNSSATVGGYNLFRKKYADFAPLHRTTTTTIGTVQ